MHVLISPWCIFLMLQGATTEKSVWGLWSVTTPKRTAGPLLLPCGLQGLDSRWLSSWYSLLVICFRFSYILSTGLELYQSSVGSNGLLQILPPYLCTIQWLFHPQPSQGQLYVIGGSNGHSDELSCGEAYDPHADEWAQIPELRTNRCNAG